MNTKLAVLLAAAATVLFACAPTAVPSTQDAAPTAIPTASSSSLSSPLPPLSVQMLSQSHLVIRPGNSFTSLFTASGLVTGIQLNGAFNTACSHTNAAPDVINCGITTTPAHLDAAAGAAGFGQNAFNLGGASVSAFF
jgi:hypothetical protein